MSSERKIVGNCIKIDECVSLASPMPLTIVLLFVELIIHTLSGTHLHTHTHADTLSAHGEHTCRLQRQIQRKNVIRAGTGQKVKITSLMIVRFHFPFGNS